MLPIFELRGAIPAGYALGMDEPLTIYLLAVAGNFVPVLPILLLLGPAERILRRFRVMDRFFTGCSGAPSAAATSMRRYESLGLILFVADARADDRRLDRLHRRLPVQTSLADGHAVYHSWHPDRRRGGLAWSPRGSSRCGDLTAGIRR